LYRATHDIPERDIKKLKELGFSIKYIPRICDPRTREKKMVAAKLRQADKKVLDGPLNYERWKNRTEQAVADFFELAPKQGEEAVKYRLASMIYRITHADFDAAKAVVKKIIINYSIKLLINPFIYPILFEQKAVLGSPFCLSRIYLESNYLLNLLVEQSLL
jgi:DNA-binding transcriptional MerR regulator